MCWAHNYSLRGNILRLCAYMHIDHHLASTRSCIESVCINNHHTHTPTHKRGDTWGLWMSGWLVYLFTRCLYPGQVISNSLMDTSLCFENISQSLPLRVFVNWQLNKEHTHTCTDSGACGCTVFCGCWCRLTLQSSLFLRFLSRLRGSALLSSDVGCLWAAAVWCFFS